jgi:hypothetical protein
MTAEELREATRWEAYFAARLALNDLPDVRVFTRDDLERGDLVHVLAVQERDGREWIGQWPVSVAHAFDGYALRWQAGELAAQMQPPSTRPGAASYVAASGWMNPGWTGWA